MRNRIGPRTVPWGTPLITAATKDIMPSRATTCSRSVRKSAIQLYNFPVIPFEAEFDGPLCQKLWQSLEIWCQSLYQKED